MVLFNLLTLNAAHAHLVTQLVLTEHLATDVFVDEAIANHRLQPDERVAPEPLYRVLFLTKALLCSRIEARLQAQMPANDFRIYTTPVAHVNEAEAERVRQLCPA